MKVFVAGATGAIGRQLVPRLVEAGHEVHGMTRKEASRAALEELGAVPVIADALDPAGVVAAVVTAAPDAIVHELTSIGDIDTRHMDRSFETTNRLRTEGTDNLLAAGREAGVKRFVAQSHILAYARSGTGLNTEGDPDDTSPTAGMGPQLDAIQHLEEAVLGAGWTEGVVLRYGWFYGPGTSMARGSEQAKLVRRRRFPVVADGAAVWSFIDVADAAAATVAALERASPGTYNVVDDDPAPVADWLPAYAAELGAKPPRKVPRFVGRLFAGETGVAMMTELRGVSNAKAKQELRWSPAHPTWRGRLANA
jgi:nucleoside-diphosphate-sugar epimerase